MSWPQIFQDRIISERWKNVFPVTIHLAGFLKLITKGGILESLFYHGFVQLPLKPLGQFTRYSSRNKVQRCLFCFVLLIFVSFYLLVCLFVLSYTVLDFFFFCNLGAENGMKIFASFLVSLSIRLVPRSFLKRLKLSSCLPSFSSVLKTDCVKVVTQISVWCTEIS